MFRRILIANRGEVASRVARTCRRMGVQTVAVASRADLDAQWLADVDRVVCVGDSPPAASYLDAQALIEVARHHACAAVHPGWGFLSENASFATRCAASGLTFIGPSARHLREMGDKALARDTFAGLGLAPIPGTKGVLASLADAQEQADAMGYPVLLKAVAGGGGRGMRAVDAPADLAAAWDEATAESASAFGDGRLYLEKRIVGGRHIEVQVVGDRWGHVVHLGERECSLQRRHQKVVEEAPSVAFAGRESERDAVLARAAEAVRRAGYVGAGTVEMLLDQDGHLWFMEMNTRLQVEHGVSEERTGVDLVEWQLRVAANEALPKSQPDITPCGHVIELRVNAEDPEDGFRPCPGNVTALSWPSGDGVRVDTHLRAGDRISPFYDSMVGKLVVSGATRDQALTRAREAVAATTITGVTTNLGLHARILRWAPFVSGRYHTTSLETDLLG